MQALNRMINTYKKQKKTLQNIHYEKCFEASNYLVQPYYLLTLM